MPKPAVYTFLGLATLPRFRGRARDGPRTRGARRAANPLRLLPREIVIQIARFAYHRRPVRYLVRYAADPALDAGDGEPPYDCCGASRRWFFEHCGRRPNRVVFRLVV